MHIGSTRPVAWLLAAGLALGQAPALALADTVTSEPVAAASAALPRAQTLTHHMGERPWDETAGDGAFADAETTDDEGAALADAVRLRLAGGTGLSYRLVSVAEEAGQAEASPWVRDGQIARIEGAARTLMLRVDDDLAQSAEVWVNLRACRGEAAGWCGWVSAATTEAFTCPEGACIGEVALAVTEPGAAAPASLTPAWSAASSLAAQSAPVAQAHPALEAAEATWTRLAGDDRYDTSARIAREGFEEGTWAVLTTGERFPDALAAGSLAGALASPILLTPAGSLAAQTKADLERRGVEHVLVVGGTSSVSEDVTAELDEMGLAWERVSGDDRVGTSLAVLDHLKQAGVSYSQVIIASGGDFPDALSVSPYAYAAHVPILLTDGSGTLSDATLGSLDGVTSAVIVGGEWSVSELVEGQLEELGITATRLAGDDRYETSTKVAAYSCANGLSWKTVSIASGKSFPDALAGGAFAGVSAGPLLVANSTDDSTCALVREHADEIESGYVLGGPSSVPFDDPTAQGMGQTPGKTGYQNPEGYYQVSSQNVQITDEAQAPWDYVTPSRISADATREECVQAFIERATEYLGSPYVWNYSCAPEVGVDCIGLVYQCAYACGMDLGGGTSDVDFNPWAHYITGNSGWHSHDANNFWDYGRALHVSYADRQPGDVISWYGHVAIYIGDDQMIQAYSPATGVIYSSVMSYGEPRGCIRLFQ